MTGWGAKLSSVVANQSNRVTDLFRLACFMLIYFHKTGVDLALGESTITLYLSFKQESPTQIPNHPLARLFHLLRTTASILSIDGYKDTFSIRFSRHLKCYSNKKRKPISSVLLHLMYRMSVNSSNIAINQSSKPFSGWLRLVDSVDTAF